MTGDEDRCEQFRADGVVALREVVPPAWLDRLRDAVDRCIGEDGPDTLRLDEDQGGSFTIVADASSRYPALAEFFRSRPQVVDTLRRLVGAERSLRLLDDQIFVKEPRTTRITPWHHDITYWAIAGNQVLSLWVALDEVDTGSGGLELVAGSHRWAQEFTAVGIVPTPEMHDPAHVEPLPDHVLRSEHRIVSYPLRPGDAIAFHARTLHFAGGNSSTNRRRGFVTRWVGDDVVFAPRRHSSRRHVRAGEAMKLRPGDLLSGEAFPQFWSRN